MKKTVVALSFLAALPALASESVPHYVVSDIDDTVKVTNVRYPVDAVLNGLFSKRAFVGMNTLYEELRGTRKDRFGSDSENFFVSGSPTFLRETVEEFLTENRFAPYSLTLRQWGKESTLALKVRTIQAIIDEKVNETPILVGDDGEKDPEVFEIVSRQRPGKPAAIYVHRVRGRSIPADQVPFNTAMDVAIREHLAGRLSLEQVQRVGESILANDDSEALIMNHNYCPMTPEGDSELLKTLPEADSVYQLAAKIENQVVEICKERAERLRIEEEQRVSGI